MANVTFRGRRSKRLAGLPSKTDYRLMFRGAEWKTNNDFRQKLSSWKKEFVNILQSHLKIQVIIFLFLRCSVVLEEHWLMSAITVYSAEMTINPLKRANGKNWPISRHICHILLLLASRRDEEFPVLHLIAVLKRHRLCLYIDRHSLRRKKQLKCFSFTRVLFLPDILSTYKVYVVLCTRKQKHWIWHGPFPISLLVRIIFFAFVTDICKSLLFSMAVLHFV